LSSARAALAEIADARIEKHEDPGDDGVSSVPLVSVVIPNFNDAPLLGACIESVCSQTFADWECIVVDDASVDDSVHIAWKMAETDQRVRVVRHTRNAGLAAARNSGLRLARGHYTTFLDSDDFLTPESIADRVAHLLPHANDPVVAGGYCGVMLAPHDAQLRDYQDSPSWSGRTIDFISDGDRCPFNAHAPLVETAVLRGVGGFDESMRHGAEDWEMWYRVLRSGFRFVPASLQSAIYRQKPGSMKLTSASDHFSEAERLTSAAYLAGDPSIAVSAARSPLLAAKQDYQVQVLLVRRAIQSAATMYLAENESTSISALEAIEPVHPFVVLAARPEVAIDDGFRRYLGLMPTEIRDMRKPLTAARDRMIELVDTAIPIEISSSDVNGRMPIDVLLLPQNSHQARSMLDAVAGFEGLVWIVDASYAAGNQGAAEVLADEALCSVRVVSYNEAFFIAPTPSTIVVASPCGPALKELIDFVSTSETAVVGLTDPLDGVVTLPCANSLEPGYWAAAAQLRDTIAADRSSDRDSGSFSLVETWRSVAMDSGQASTMLTWAADEYPASVDDGVELRRFKDCHAGETVVIIGNGPSLNDTDLSLLSDVQTIGVNGIFYADDRLPNPLTYYVVEDNMVVRDNLDAIRSYKAGHRFFPSIYRDLIGDSDDTTYFRMNRGFYAEESPYFCMPRFSVDPVQRVYAGQSVTIMNLQLAYFMGFSEVVLIGMDFSYQVPAASEVSGALITSMGDDPNHFHPDYFGKGKVWKDPKLDRVLANYALARQIFEADGRRILNATPGGNLELFDRTDLAQILKL
jgi:GT2 family glycosyltransferase